MGRKQGFIPLVFFGVGGIPFAQAKSVPVNVVVGKPIKVAKIEDGMEVTTEMLQPILDEFIAATVRLFENNKAKFDMGDFNLVIH
jgi:hypothetical protein